MTGAYAPGVAGLTAFLERRVPEFTVKRARVLMRVLCLFALVLFVGTAHAAGPESEALGVLRQAMEAEKDVAVLQQSLARIDAILGQQPKDATAHYARGWILSRLGRTAPAVAAYDRAFALDGKLVDAAYNAGVVLAAAGDRKEAVVRFERALASDPKFVDAAYNAGQAYYDLKLYAKADAKWRIAQALAPDDFDVAKKLVQTSVALGDDAATKVARDRVFALKKAAKDPRLAKLPAYVYDQFDVGKLHIYVYESFDASGDLAYVFRFQVTDQEKPIGSVNLETSAVIREQGVPFVLGVDKGSTHRTLGQHAWKTQPDYRALKAIVTKVIAESFP